MVSASSRPIGGRLELVADIGGHLLKIPGDRLAEVDGPAQFPSDLISSIG
jgi:hypothetical protein